MGKIPWRRKWQPTPVFLPGESRGQRSLAGYSPWGRKKSDRTERLSTVALWRGWTVFGGLRCGPEKREGLCKKRIQSKWPSLRESVFSFIYIFVCLFVLFGYAGPWLPYLNSSVFIVMWRIFNCSMWTLSCGVCSLVPWPGIEPRCPALGAWRFSHWTTREVPLEPVVFWRSLYPSLTGLFSGELKRCPSWEEPPRSSGGPSTSRWLALNSLSLTPSFSGKTPEPPGPPLLPWPPRGIWASAAGQIRAFHVGYMWDMDSDLERNRTGHVLATMVEAFPQSSTLSPSGPGISEVWGKWGRWRQTGSCGSRELWLKTLVVPVMRDMIWSQILNSLCLGFLICKLDWCLTEFLWEWKETLNIKTSSVSWRMVGIEEMALPGSRARNIRVTWRAAATMLLWRCWRCRKAAKSRQPSDSFCIFAC